MSPEPFTDLNENKQYDKAEEFEDLNSNGEWSYFDGSVDTVFDAFDNVIATYEFDNNGLFDYYDYGTDGIEGEPYTDTSGNGHWDFGEPFEDLDGNFQCTGCDLDGSEGNGYFDEGEPAEGHELWTDANDNGLWDKAEEFEDQNGNNSWDAESPLTALVDEIQDPDGSTRRYYAFNWMRDDPDTWYLTMAMRSAKEFLNFPPDSLRRLGGGPEKGSIGCEEIESRT